MADNKMEVTAGSFAATENGVGLGQGDGINNMAGSSAVDASAVANAMSEATNLDDVSMKQHTIGPQQLDFHQHNGDKTQMRDNSGAPMYLLNKPSLKFFVGGIHPEAWEDDVKKHFSQYGTVKEVQVMKDHTTGRNRGFGFVTMVDSGIRDAIFNIEHSIKNKKVEVRDMQPEGTSNLNRKVFIGGINPALNEENLRDYFRHYGTIEKVTIMRDSEGKSRAFGFVVYVDEIAVKKVLEKSIHYIDGDNKIEVRAAEARHRLNSQRGRDALGRGGRGAGPYGYAEHQSNPYTSSYPWYSGRGGAYAGYGGYSNNYSGYGAYNASGAYALGNYGYGGTTAAGYGAAAGYGGATGGVYAAGSYTGVSDGVYVGSSGTGYTGASGGYGSTSGYGGSRGGQGYDASYGGQSATGYYAQQEDYSYGPHRATGLSQGRGRGYRTGPY